MKKFEFRLAESDFALSAHSVQETVSGGMVGLRPRMPPFLLADTHAASESMTDTKSTSKAIQKLSGTKRKRQEEGMNPYEQERLDRIARNRKVMAELGIKEAYLDFQDSVMGSKKAPALKRPKAKAPQPVEPSERRKSARIDPTQRPVYQDSKAFEALMSSDRSSSGLPVTFHMNLLSANQT